MVGRAPQRWTRRRVKKLLVVAAAAVALIVGVVLARTFGYGSPPPAAERVAEVAIRPGAAERLAGALRIPTISDDTGTFDGDAFRALHDHLRAEFPRAHAELRREAVATHSLLYTWPGRDPSLAPILIAAHLDVVPIEPGTEAQWQEAPFGGRIEDGFIWGRGAIDNKSAVLGTLEAVEMLLGEGFRPARTVYLAFGHDEEVGGTSGAREIAALLARRGAQLEGPTRQLFERIAPELAFARRAVFANLWLTRPLVTRQLGASPTTDAMVRTTTAATVFQAGTKDNVLPRHARAVVNFRTLPGDSVTGVLARVRRVVDDPRVEVRAGGRFSAEPSAVSSTDSESYRMLERTIREVVPDAVVAPYLVVVVTDARYYGGLSRNVFRFLPLRLTQMDLARMHGTNERIGVHEYEQAIRLYRQLMLNAAGG